MAPLTLVTGGAGYIGSHTVLALRERGRDVLVLDDLSEGHEAALLGAPLVRGSILDCDFLARVFAGHDIGGVLHFAARCYVGESVRDPASYYRANVVGTLQLLEAMVAAGVRRFVFSSSCATYGEPERQPIEEDAPQRPINPYGETKRVGERLLHDFARAHGVRSVSLRYFNAAGADPGGRLGEDHEPETHLIPLALRAVAGGPELVVFGDDYPTRDGTCVRDYVHVTDLAEAHVLALEALESRDRAEALAYNLGNEHGTTVREVLHAVAEVTGRPVPHRLGPRREGDPPVLVGSSARIARDLGWRPQHGDIATIVRTAWNWHEAHPGGYGEPRVAGAAAPPAAEPRPAPRDTHGGRR